MKVAMLTTVGSRCGIAAYTRALVEAFRALPDVAIEVVPIEEGKQPPEHYIDQASRLNAAEVDVVHIQHEHCFWGGILPRASAFHELRSRIKKPVVLTAHTTTSLADLLKVRQERRPHKWLVKQMLLRSRAYRESVDTTPFSTATTIVHTAAARNELIARGAAPDNVFVVPTGIPAPVPAPTHGESFRERFNLQGRRIVTLFGYITPNKGYELTLQILPYLPQDVSLVIAGGARCDSEIPYEQSVRQAVEQSGQAHRVVITGYLEDTDLAEAMEATEIALVPHTYATGSYSVTLPITHGRPILASNLDCFQEIADRMDCVELFPAGDATAYQKKLLDLLENPARRTRLSAEARRYAEQFSWPGIAQMTRRIYGLAIDASGQ